nr:hypothetical protein [Tanacetum cinerariifolium]
PTVQDISTPMENNLDYAEELARLQRQEYKAHSAAAKHGFEFSVDTASLLPQANIEIRRNLVPAAGDHAGGIVPTGGVPAGSDPAGGIVPTGGVLASSSVPASDVPTGSIPARSVPTGGVLAGSLVSTDSAASSIPAASVFVPAVVLTDSAANSPLPLIYSLGSCAHPTRFPSPSDLGNHLHRAGIFSSSSYDDDFCANVTNLDSNVALDPVATKRVNFIHPQSQILGDLQSPVQTWSTMQKSKFDECAFINNVQNQNRTNHADHLHCLFAYFLSRLEPSSVATVLVDPDWVAAMQEEMQQFYHQQVWKLVHLPAGKIAIGTKWILKNKQDARGISPIEAIRLFLAFASYMGFMVYQMDVKSVFLYGEIEEEVYVTQPKGFEDLYNPKHVYRVVKALYGLYQAPRACQDKYVKDMLKKFDMESVRTATTPYEVPKHKSKDEPDDAVNVHLFRSMIGSLMYLIASRPDIMFAVSVCSTHQVSPLTSHLNAVKKIFNDYAGSHGDKKSTTGGCQFLGRRLISWQCKKQTVLATSSTEAEYVATVSCCGQDRADDLVSAGGCTLPAGSYLFLLLDWFLLVVLLVHADAFVPAGRCTISTGRSYCWTGSYWYALTHRPTMVFDSLVKQFWATATVRTLEAGPSDIIATIDGTEVVVTESLIRTQLHLDDVNGLYEFTLHDVLDGMRAIRPITFLVPAGGDAVGAAANVAAGPGPSSAPQVPPEPTPDSPNPPSPPPSSAAIGPTTSNRPPSPSRHPSVPDDIREGGGDFVSSPQSNEAPQTLAAPAAGEAEDSAALTALSLKLDRCLHRVTTLENELGITKKVLGGAVLKLVTQVKRLEGLLQQRKRRLVLSDSEGEDATTTEQECDLAALHTLASATLGDDSSATAAGPDAKTTMPVYSTSTTRRRLRKQFTSSIYVHVSETIPAGVHVPAVATTIPAGSSMDVAVHAAAAPSSSIPTAADKGKAPMVDDSLPIDLLLKQECVLKNLHDSQRREELAKKIHAEQEAEFSRQQEELAQKAQVESVASPTEHALGISNQRRRELDAAQLIYTEADWLDLLAKIATNSALSKQLLGDDVTEDNTNERLGMLLLRKRRELAEQSRVKPMTKIQQRDYMRDFVKNSSASVYNQGWTMKKPTLDAPPAKRATQGAPLVPAVSSQDPAGVPAAPSIPADVSLPAATSSAHADIPVPVVFIAHAAVSVPAEPMVHPAKSHMDAPLTAPEHGSSEPTVATPLPSSSRHRRKHIVKKRVTPIVDVADAAMIKFYSDSDSDDDPLPYAPYAGWEMVPFPLGSVHAYHNMAGHTKHFTTLHEILHMVERTDLQRLLGDVDALYQSKEPNTFSLLLWGDLHVLFQSLDDKDALYFWRTQDSWRIRSWRLYPQAQVHMLEMVDGRVIHMLIDVFYPLSVGFSCWFSTTLQMVFSSPWLTAKKELTHHEGTALSWLVQEQMALGKDISNPLTVGSLLKTTWSSIHHLLTDEVLASLEQMATDQMLLSHDPAVLGVPAGFVLLLFGWLLLVLFMLLE